MRGRVVVVGAGIVGLATALRLRDDSWAVTVIDASQPASGASAAALGSLTPYSDHGSLPETRALAESSLAMYSGWLDRLSITAGQPIDFDPCGLVECAIGDEEAPSLRSTFEALRESGAPVDWLSPKDVLALEPRVTKDVSAGLFYRTEAMVDVSQLLAACIQAARIRGCTIVSNLRVTRILESHGRVCGVDTPLGPVPADHVVLAAGSRLDTISCGATVSIQRIRGEVLEVRSSPGLVGRHLYSGSGFLRPLRDGRIYLGSNYDVHGADDDECPTTVSAHSAARTLDANIRIVPALAESQLVRSWKGWRPRTIDGQPLIGRCSVPGVVVAGGFFGLGITLAPAVAEEIAALISDDKYKASPVFAPDRFEGSQGFSTASDG